MLAGAACRRGSMSMRTAQGLGRKQLVAKHAAALRIDARSRLRNCISVNNRSCTAETTHVNFSQISHPGDFDEFKVRVDAGQRNALLMRLSQTQIASATVKGMVPVF